MNERFRERRRRARRRRRIRRLTALGALLAVAAAAGLGAAFITNSSPRLTDVAGGKLKPVPKPHPRALPREVRGVHVTMALASIPGKLDEYLDLQGYGLNTIELDVKDENGEVGFQSARYAPEAIRTGAAKAYYDPRAVARAVHARGMYLIGRVVTFEDPVLTTSRPDLALHTTDGSVWHNNGGLGWSNEYDKRVWKYNVDIAVAAAKAGFDEIQFDYVRFPSDGDLSLIVYPGARKEPKGTTIANYLQYAVRRLRPLGVRISADLFGLAASHDLGIGQVPRKVSKFLDAIYPMVYPSHFGPGEYNLDNPNDHPGTTVTFALRDFARQMRGHRAKLIPWLQDFSLYRTYTEADVEDQIAAAESMPTRGFLLWNAAGVYTRNAIGYGS